ncbi:hypothetical protein BGX38DRAFT_1186186 [Terfezia claveryi]|nr:hypothetical protein BGX38DRAFT_1186186 [Terfezia claveryi]
MFTLVTCERFVYYFCLFIGLAGCFTSWAHPYYFPVLLLEFSLFFSFCFLVPGFSVFGY